MMTRPSLARRGILVIILVGLLFGLCVWYGTLNPNPQVGSYPGNSDVGQSPSKYVGNLVAVDGTVVDTNPTVIMMSYGSASTRLLTVVSISKSVREGQNIRVFGRLTDTETIRAHHTVMAVSTGYLYMYVVSLLAGLWVLARIVLQWRFDPELGFVRRHASLTPIRRLQRWLRNDSSGVSDTDA